MKKTYMTPESVVLHVALTLPIAAGSDPGVTVNQNDAGINPSSFESKEDGDADTWELWEE